MRRSAIIRSVAGVCLIGLLVGAMSQQPPAEIRRFEKARDGLRALMNQAEGLFSDDERAQLDTVVTTLQLSLNYWQAAPQDREVAALARKNCMGAVARAQWVIDSAPQVVRVEMNGQEVMPREISARLPYGPGGLILRVVESDATPGDIPDFVRANSDGVAKLGDAQIAYVLAGVSPGQKQLRLVSAKGATATLGLALETPLTGVLNVEVVDGESGKVTPAVAGVYGRDEHLFVPTDALSFDNGGFSYSSGRVRPNREARYWPGSPDERRVFFSRGAFSVTVPEGRYTVIAGKGMEYRPVVRSVEVKAGAAETEKIVLERWIDMPARGWYSGDMHVHWARTSDRANAPLLEWTKAEDVHVANVLRMGDAKETYFEQYGFGTSGRVVEGNYALVPGQEDPRTNVIGHTLHLKLLAPVRDTERYYLFDRVFDEVARQGGLNGYAHMQQPDALGFFVRRSMTLEVPRGKTDFFEISEFGNVGLETYYEFLNLGFPLTAGAGSDVPWGNTIGTSRVYAYTGKSFSADAWFAALKAGHTFVTTGPMLDFRVNGEMPGSVIRAQRGDVLRVKASVEGGPVPATYLEVVADGEVVKGAQGKKDRLELEFTVPVKRSMWIAARANGAHTTPVYVKVGDERCWERSEVPQLVANRLDELKQVEEVLREGMSESHRGNWDNPHSLQDHGDELRQRIEQARAFYQGLLAEAK